MEGVSLCFYLYFHVGFKYGTSSTFWDVTTTHIYFTDGSPWARIGKDDERGGLDMTNRKLCILTFTAASLSHL